ncbi:MAG TPA: hypothetical protein VIV60_36625, partial [Polyangiaceae bacterium]
KRTLVQGYQSWLGKSTFNTDIHAHAHRITPALGKRKRRAGRKGKEEDKQMEPIQKPSIGRVVHYVLSAERDGLKRAHGEHRPAFVVRVFPGEFGTLECPDGVNLNVMCDGQNDAEISGAGCMLLWETSVPYDASGAPGTWHWPERV